MTDHTVTWCNPILSSDLPAFTRLVLITIAFFENRPDQPFTPTIKQVADATKLTERTVRKHLKIASKAGWDAASLVSNDKEGR